MKIQLIRNATMKITYAGRTFLTDPMLSPKDEFDPFAGIARNPTIDLPFQVEEVIKGIECVIVTHYHPDHFDTTASEIIPKDTRVFCQQGDEGKLTGQGFQNVIPIDTSYVWEGITITRTGGKHGSGEILQHMGEVSGFVFQAKGEPTIYWVGDCIWDDEVENAIKTFNPDIIITHSGGAIIPGFENDPILMNGEQTIIMANAAPKAKIVAIHMESLDHCTVSRKALRKMADSAMIPPSRLIIPEDGEILSF
ncbi:MBL fold metallo-hydrolase [bacterium]|nr:MBL fold metallo-hydrolase [bacterium]